MPNGLTTYVVRSARVSLGIPSEWPALTADDVSSAATDEAVDQMPELARYRELLAMPDSPLKLVALRYEAAAGANSVVLVMALPWKPGWNVREFERGVLESVHERAVPGSKPTIARVTLPAGPALKVRLRTAQNAAGGTIVGSGVIYVIRTGGKAYLLLYDTAPTLADDYARLFERSARSLRPL